MRQMVHSFFVTYFRWPTAQDKTALIVSDLTKADVKRRLFPVLPGLWLTRSD